MRLLVLWWLLLSVILILTFCLYLNTTKCFTAPNIFPFLFLKWSFFLLGMGGYWGWIPGMPTSPYLYASDLIEVLKKKHASGTYKSLVSCY